MLSSKLVFYFCCCRQFDNFMQFERTDQDRSSTAQSSKGQGRAQLSTQIAPLSRPAPVARQYVSHYAITCHANSSSLSVCISIFWQERLQVGSTRSFPIRFLLISFFIDFWRDDKAWKEDEFSLVVRYNNKENGRHDIHGRGRERESLHSLKKLSAVDCLTRRVKEDELFSCRPKRQPTSVLKKRDRNLNL